MNKRPHPVLVLTALNVEYRAVRQHLTRTRPSRHPAGTIFAEGYLARCPIPVVLAVTGEGNQTAAVLTERASSCYSPRALLYVGVAVAVGDDVRVGDVVVATRVHAYHGGKESDEGFLARPRSWDAPHVLEQLARHIDLTGNWVRWLPDGARQKPPAVHFKPIAAGEVVLAARPSPLSRRLHRSYNDAAALETESAGASTAGHLSSLPVLSIRGISREASAGKPLADANGSQAAAAAHAAAFAVGLIHAMSTQHADGGLSSGPDGGPGEMASRRAYVQNIAAHGSSTVFAVLHGDQTVHGPTGSSAT